MGIAAMSTHPQKRVWKGGKGCIPYEERQPSSRKKMLVTAATAETAKRMPRTTRRSVPMKKREIENGPYKQHATDVGFLADVILRGIAPLAHEPSRKQKQRERLLGLVTQENPTEKRGDGPHKDSGRPVFLDVEDLSDKRNGPPVEMVPSA